MSWWPLGGAIFGFTVAYLMYLVVRDAPGKDEPSAVAGALALIMGVTSTILLIAEALK